MLSNIEVSMTTVQLPPNNMNDQWLSRGALMRDEGSSAPSLRLQLEADIPHGDALGEKKWKPPPSAWIARCHPRVEEVSRVVNAYFLSKWKFPNSKSTKTFVDAGFSKVTCLYFPTAKDDRIECACRLLTVLFLIDGEKEITLSAEICVRASN